MLLLFLTAHHQFGASLVIELRCDIQPLSLGELVARHLASSTVRLDDGSGCQPKFRPTYFLPSRFHVSDGFHHIARSINLYVKKDAKTGGECPCLHDDTFKSEEWIMADDEFASNSICCDNKSQKTC